jgi:hypothetical protein
MITYFLTIDHVLSSDPQVLTHIIRTMERAQGLLDTLEVISDCQPLPALRVLVIIEPINIVHPDTVFKCNNIKIELTMKEKCCRPISIYKELTFVKFATLLPPFSFVIRDILSFCHRWTKLFRLGGRGHIFLRIVNLQIE